VPNSRGAPRRQSRALLTKFTTACWRHLRDRSGLASLDIAGGDFQLKIEPCGQGFFGGIEREIRTTTLDFGALNWFTVLMPDVFAYTGVAVSCYTNVVSAA
jgi:hypothetical protein